MDDNQAKAGSGIGREKGEEKIGDSWGEFQGRFIPFT